MTLTLLRVFDIGLPGDGGRMVEGGKFNAQYVPGLREMIELKTLRPPIAENLP